MNLTRPPNRKRLDQASSLMFAIGEMIFAFEIAKHYFLPPNLPHLAILNTICAVSSSTLISAALFLSAHGLFTERRKRALYLIVALGNGAALLIMFLFFYYQYVFFVRSLDKLESIAPNAYPQTVELMSLAKNAEDAKKWASITYQLYGVRAAYRDDTNSQVYYVPTEDETGFRHEVDQMNLAVAKLREASRGLLGGMVDLVLTAFLTFFAGCCWVACWRLETTKPTIDSSGI